jgi:hypothetical protein
MRILCAINPPEAIRKILHCLGLPSRPPPIASAILAPVDPYCLSRQCHPLPEVRQNPASCTLVLCYAGSERSPEAAQVDINGLLSEAGGQARRQGLNPKQQLIFPIPQKSASKWIRMFES